MHHYQSPAVDAAAALSRAVLLIFLACAFYLFFMGGALAQEYDTPMGDVLCDVVNFVVYGNLGRGLATLAIIIVGVGAMLGKVSWGLAITVGVGISVIFGAYDIGSALSVGGTCDHP